MTRASSRSPTTTRLDGSYSQARTLRRRTDAPGSRSREAVCKASEGVVMSTSPPIHGHHRGVRVPADRRVVDLGGLLLGLVVLAVGALLLLDSAGTLDAGRVIGDWWPVVVLAAGLLQLATARPLGFGPFFLVGAGTFLLLATTGVLGDDPWSYLWPMLVLLAGTAIVLGWFRARGGATLVGDDVVRVARVFSGSDTAVGSQTFRGAALSAIFGGVSLDLRQARPVEGASVNATAIFGGVEILVPRGWAISVRGTPVFGGVEDKTDRSVPPPDGAPRLHVDALAVFGGVEIKHEKR